MREKQAADWICARCRRINPAGRERCIDCGVEPVEPKVETPRQPAVACPRCGLNMQRGKTWLSYGFGKVSPMARYPALFFQAPDVPLSEPLVGPGRRYRAFRCARCGGVWLDPPAPYGG